MNVVATFFTRLGILPPVFLGKHPLPTPVRARSVTRRRRGLQSSIS
jgi:hypothetical protein